MMNRSGKEKYKKTPKTTIKTEKRYFFYYSGHETYYVAIWSF